MMNTMQQNSATLKAAARTIAQDSVDAQYRAEPRWEAYGDEGKRKALQDALDSLAYLIAAYEAGEPSLLADYAAWLDELFAGLKFPEGSARNSLMALADSAAKLAGQPGAALRDFSLEALAKESEAGLSLGCQELSVEAQSYLDLLLASDRKAAIGYINGLSQGGMGIKKLYLDVFAPSQRELGRLWQLNRISVAQEHYGTAVTQLAMAGLYPLLFSGQRKNRKMAGACVGGELHELGIRMVSDFFEMDGWDSRYYGANAPGVDLARQLSADPRQVLCLSATLSVNVQGVRQTIEAIRDTKNLERLPIIVGGRPFAVAERLWADIGADGTASDAGSAIALAEELVGRGR
ncbi:MAG TPA: cobalamin-binding protein [Spirochaetaceae bacterium]|nr:cobalamin-binding protein [Spirochaetaceae bacterium]